MEIARKVEAERVAAAALRDREAAESERDRLRASRDQLARELDEAATGRDAALTALAVRGVEPVAPWMLRMAVGFLLACVAAWCLVQGVAILAHQAGAELVRPGDLMQRRPEQEPQAESLRFGSGYCACGRPWQLRCDHCGVSAWLNDGLRRDGTSVLGSAR